MHLLANADQCPTHITCVWKQEQMRAACSFLTSFGLALSFFISQTKYQVHKNHLEAEKNKIPQCISWLGCFSQGRTLLEYGVGTPSLYSGRDCELDDKALPPTQTFSLPICQMLFVHFPASLSLNHLGQCSSNHQWRKVKGFNVPQEL